MKWFKSSETIRFLGITLDKDLEMKKFIATKVRNAYLNIKRINKIRKFLTEDETKMLMYSNMYYHTLTMETQYWSTSPNQQ